MTSRADRIVAMFERDRYTDLLGMRLVSTDPVTMEMAITGDLLNFHEITHGGAMFSLADSAFSLASNAHGDRAVAIGTHLALTAGAAIGDTLTAVAAEVTRGRTFATYQVTLTRSDGRVCGLFTGTVHITRAAS
ncbi:MAG: hotdog fold thioesterase [Acidimicrobiia bacterium]